MSDLSVIAFDVFGTVVDFSSVDRQEVRDYVAQIQQPVWAPLRLPASWECLPAFPDSAEGIARLRRSGFLVVTLSNGPLGLLARLSRNAGISWDAIIPLEMKRVYKPNPAAYLTVCELLGVLPAKVMMVTAHATFGDLEAARSLGMQAKLIRGEFGLKTIIDLAESLGC